MFQNSTASQIGLQESARVSRQHASCFSSPSPPVSDQQRLRNNRQRASQSIKATDVAQWRWTNSQCKEWLTEVLVIYCGKSRVAAKELASQFVGFGPNLYVTKYSGWEGWLGVDGRAIYALLLEMKNDAVPKGISIDHDA
jgi:hypothetical protein